jgi:hypothetical protein
MTQTLRLACKVSVENLYAVFCKISNSFGFPPNDRQSSWLLLLHPVQWTGTGSSQNSGRKTGEPLIVEGLPRRHGHGTERVGRFCEVLTRWLQ